uniref:Elongation factor Ts, mitochondrial n=2 Tax=Porphyridium purpureum TaxID=35688 RepID=W0RZB8_PORPP|nr:translation elongation factor Ts [Porphyridium purpureum]ATJ02999.1 translation elongation factor Ts [Porphyridium purpureum]BAO23787.1 translation elongation factor Ts [Porphyridium purpureum]
MSSINISAQSVKELREMTGAGMMDCKKALKESDGNLEQAIEALRKKGLATANKKSMRQAAEGIIESYIHTGGKIGILLELNCETDFVARRSEFQALAKDIAMQVAASPDVEFISTENVSKEFIDEESKIEAEREDLKNKPEAIRDKIVQGRIEKRLKEKSLIDQPFIKNPDITVDELIKQNIAKIGENIQIKRFVRYKLGEGTIKEEKNFADEVSQILNK